MARSIHLVVLFRLFLVLLSAGGTARAGKYVYVSGSKSWFAAQSYCREHFTDLAPVSGPEDELKMKREAEEGQKGNQLTWIGLYREVPDLEVWKWSGGGPASYLNWELGQPDSSNAMPELTAGFHPEAQTGWHDAHQNSLRPFFCLRLTVVKVMKTWEEAMEHCREHHEDLASLLSQTEVTLAQRELGPAGITQRAWTGLRYLGDRWMWVNGDELEHRAWGQAGDGDRCPHPTSLCGAVSKQGEWESRDCGEKLPFICH